MITKEALKEYNSDRIIMKTDDCMYVIVHPPKEYLQNMSDFYNEISKF